METWLLRATARNQHVSWDVITWKHFRRQNPLSSDYIYSVWMCLVYSHLDKVSWYSAFLRVINLLCGTIADALWQTHPIACDRAHKGPCSHWWLLQDTQVVHFTAATDRKWRSGIPQLCLLANIGQSLWWLHDVETIPLYIDWSESLTMGKWFGDSTVCLLLAWCSN